MFDVSQPFESCIGLCTCVGLKVNFSIHCAMPCAEFHCGQFALVHPCESNFYPSSNCSMRDRNLREVKERRKKLRRCRKKDKWRGEREEEKSAALQLLTIHYKIEYNVKNYIDSKTLKQPTIWPKAHTAKINWNPK